MEFVLHPCSLNVHELDEEKQALWTSLVDTYIPAHEFHRENICHIFLKSIKLSLQLPIWCSLGGNHCHPLQTVAMIEGGNSMTHLNVIWLYTVYKSRGGYLCSVSFSNNSWVTYSWISTQSTYKDAYPNAIHIIMAGAVIHINTGYCSPLRVQIQKEPHKSPYVISFIHT